jgi:DegV family protein with EDD domain
LPVTVVTDTTHYLPPQIVAANGLHEVSLYVTFQGRQTRESEIMLDTDTFYDAMRSAADLPTTSQPSIGDFLAVYEPLVAAGQDIVSVHIAGGISGTVESARQAASELLSREGSSGRRIEVIDSRTACAGLGLAAIAASNLARTGADAETVAQRARDASDAMKIWFVVDTLEFLRRGGRIGAAQAWLGGALKIKPILTFSDTITPLERVRTSGRAFERMVDYLRSRHEDGADAWVIQHVRAPEQAERLVDRGREIFGTDPAFVSEIGPVIGTHAGPGVLGVGGIPSALL